MPVASVRGVTVSFGVLVVVLAGCADPRPAVESGESSLAGDGDTSLSSSSAAVATRVCSPGAVRDCSRTWYDIEGHKHCNEDTQVCRGDGYAWLPCGEHDGGVTDAGAEEADQHGERDGG